MLAAGLVVAITSSHYLWHCNLLDNSVPFAFSIINNYVEKFSVNDTFIYLRIEQYILITWADHQILCSTQFPVLLLTLMTKQSGLSQTTTLKFFLQVILLGCPFSTCAAAG